MLEKEFNYFQENKEKFSNLYDNKFIIIVGQSVIQVFDDKYEAYQFGVRKYGLGHFFLQECSKNQEIYIRHFSSRAVI